MTVLKKFSLMSASILAFSLAAPASAQSAKDLLINASGASRSGDHVKALSFYEAAARLGDVNAQLYTAQIYKNGAVGVVPDKSKAADWYEKAAIQGDRISMRYLGELYEKGEGRTQSNEVALRWYKAAADAGSGIAKKKYDALKLTHDFMTKGLNSPELSNWKPPAAAHSVGGFPVYAPMSGDAQTLEAGLAALDGLRTDEALSFLKPLADRGHGKALLSVGEIYMLDDLHGTGQPNGLDQAVLYLTAATHHGEGQAYIALADIYAKGYGGGYSDAKAWEWLDLASRSVRISPADRAWAHFGLSKKYETGRGVSQSAKLALSHAKTAAEMAATEAQITQRYQRLKEDGSAPDEMDLVMGDRYAQFAKLGNEGAFQSLKSLADDGDANAMFHMYRMYRGKMIGDNYEDYTGVKRDKAKSVAYLRRAAALGSNKGRMDLGALHTRDDGFVPTEYSTAIGLFEKVLGSPYADDAAKGLAAFRLGNMHNKGLGVSKSVGLAVKYYEQAGSLGHRKSYHYLGLIYQKGMGVSKSDAKSYGYFLKAAELGYAEAQYQVAYAYLNGEGTARNDAKGRSWLVKAAENGHVTAKAQLPEVDKVLAARK